MNEIVVAVVTGGAAGGAIVGVLVNFLARRFLSDFDAAIKSLRAIELRLASVDLQLAQALEVRTIVSSLERRVTHLEAKIRSRSHHDDDAIADA